MTLTEALAGTRRAVLDTAVLIYYLEDSPIFGDAAAEVVDAAAMGLFTGVITPVTAAELLVKPVQAGRHQLADHYRHAMTGLDNVDTVPLSWKAGCLAGALRAKYALPLPDMLQVGVAIDLGSCGLITSDRHLGRVEEIPVVLLSDLNKA